MQGTLHNPNSSININTTSAVPVGTFNGKPLYRKTFIGHTTTAGISIIGNIADATLAYIDSANTFAIGTNGNILPIYYVSNTEGWFAYVRSDKAICVRVIFDPPTGISDYYVSVLYTTT